MLPILSGLTGPDLKTGCTEYRDRHHRSRATVRSGAIGGRAPAGTLSSVLAPARTLPTMSNLLLVFTPVGRGVRSRVYESRSAHVPWVSGLMSRLVVIEIESRIERATGHLSAWKPSTRSTVSRCASRTPVRV